MSVGKKLLILGGCFVVFGVSIVAGYLVAIRNLNPTDLSKSVDVQQEQRDQEMETSGGREIALGNECIRVRLGEKALMVTGTIDEITSEEGWYEIRQNICSTDDSLDAKTLTLKIPKSVYKINSGVVNDAGGVVWEKKVTQTVISELKKAN